MSKKEQEYYQDPETRQLGASRYAIAYEGVRTVLASTEMYELPSYPQPPLKEAVAFERPVVEVPAHSIDPTIADNAEYVDAGIADIEDFANGENLLTEDADVTSPEYLDSTSEISDNADTSPFDIGDLAVAQFFSEG